ncbi:caspase domain-containing protein [Mycena sanguinolenta]|nr:caspase domain-containing protein [Mycena sanguinolenta]
MTFPLQSWSIRSDVPNRPPLFSSTVENVASATQLLPLESWSIRSEVPLVTPLPRSITIPLESRRPARKALLIGICRTETLGQLPTAHADVYAVRDLLLDIYHYSSPDITILIDDGVPGHIQPTRANILSAIAEFVKDTKAGDRLCFHYCGPSTQIPNRANSEDDGMDECLIPCDGVDRKIMDHELNRALVRPLPAACQLVAVLDTCNSGPLLDLKHHRCSRVVVPWLWRGRRRNENRHPVKKSARQVSRSRVADSLAEQEVMVDQAAKAEKAILHASTRMFATPNEISMNLAWASSARLHPGGSTVTYRARADAFETDALATEDGWSISTLAEAEQCDSPVAMFEGMMWLREMDGKSNPKDGVDDVVADVISLSSCTDSQETTKDEGNSMTAALVEILRHDPNRSLKDVLINVGALADVRACSRAMCTKALVQHKPAAASQHTRKEREIRQLRPTLSLRVVGTTEPLTRAPTLRSFLARRVGALKPKRPRSIPRYIVELPSALSLDMERQWRM